MNYTLQLISKHIGSQLFSANLFILILAFCPEKYPYSTNFGRICCQEKPDRDAFLNEFCRKDQVGTCQAFNVNQKFRCGNHQSVEENCKFIYNTYLHMYNTGTPEDTFTRPALSKKKYFKSGLIRKKQG